VEQEYEANKNETLRPIYKFLKKFETFNKFLFYFLVVTFFFQKPTWCVNRGKLMSPDCNYDKWDFKENKPAPGANEYYVSKLLALPDFVMNSSAFISWFIMFFLILGDLIVVIFVGSWTYKIRVAGMVAMLALDVVFKFLTSTIDFFLFKYQLSPFFRIIFMILYNTSMRNSMIRLFYTIKGAYEAIFVFLLNLAIWSGFAYILFHGKSRI
jgi:hypothetical protein